MLMLHKAPAKRSQHANATYRNIVGRNRLRAFGHRVAMCYNTLGVVCSRLKMVKFEPTTPNMSQKIANTVAKRSEHGAPNNVAIYCVGMLRSFGWGLSFGLTIYLYISIYNYFRTYHGSFPSQCAFLYSKISNPDLLIASNKTAWVLISGTPLPIYKITWNIRLYLKITK